MAPLSLRRFSALAVLMIVCLAYPASSRADLVAVTEQLSRAHATVSIHVGYDYETIENLFIRPFSAVAMAEFAEPPSHGVAGGAE